MRSRKFCKLIIVAVLSLLVVGCGAIPTGDGTAAAVAEELRAQVQSQRLAMEEARIQMREAQEKVAGSGDAGRQVVELQREVAKLREAATTRPNDPDLKERISAARANIDAIAGAPGSGIDAGTLKRLQQLEDGLIAVVKVAAEGEKRFGELADKLKGATDPDTLRAVVAEEVARGARDVGNNVPGATIPALVVSLIASGIAAYFKRRADVNAAAGASAVNAIELALRNGDLSASKSAVKTVDDAIMDHPISNRLTDVVASSSQ